MDIARRLQANPLVRPQDVKPSMPGLEVKCVLNPGAFRWKNKTWMLMRVAELQSLKPGIIGTPIMDSAAPGGMRLFEVRRDDPNLANVGVHVFEYKKEKYLTTVSHLRLACSDDGEHFAVAGTPTLLGQGALETFGIEDCRVSQIDDIYYLTFTAVSESGVGVGLITTRNWKTFRRHGMIFPPQNKDCALFERRFGSDFVCLHRPVGTELGGPYMWLARSKDLVHWGRYACIARTRPGQWDEERIGAGAAPIRTKEGWLCIYHGTDRTRRYCLGALLLDLKRPEQVLARSREPIMEPTAPYEAQGFFSNCVFTNGHVVDGDCVTVYYGAADSVVCGAQFSIRDILGTLK